LLNQLGVDNNKIYPKYCAGGCLKNITKGKYRFDFIIPEDTITKLALLEAGIPEKNLRPDQTRNTLLALFLNRPIAWGYRTEIEIVVNHPTKQLLDVGTLEYFCWDPIFNGEYSSKNIMGLNNISYTLALSVVGIERLAMISQNTKDIRNIDYLKNYYNILRQKYPKGLIGGEMLRTLHFIIADIKKFKLTIGKHRGYMMNLMARQIFFELSLVKELLKINAASQPWHAHLKAGVALTVEFIKNYRNLNKNYLSFNGSAISQSRSNQFLTVEAKAGDSKMNE